MNCHTFTKPKPPPAIATVGYTLAAAQQLAPIPFSPVVPPAVSDIGPIGKKATQPRQLDTHDDWRVIQRAFAFVLAAAVLFNMLGLGGGFVYVPILLLFGVNFHTASATSLFVITAAHLSAIFVFSKSSLIDYKLALALEPITCLGAFLGGLASDSFGEVPLSVLFAMILLIASYSMRHNPENYPKPAINRSTKWSWHRTFGPYNYVVDLPLGLPLALAIGFIGGLLGFAGGVIKIPMMVLLFGVPIKVAIATSTLMVSLTSMVGCIGHGIRGDFDLLLSAVLAIAGIAGAQIGSRLTVRADRVMLKKIFSVVLLIVAVWMIGRII